jgi:hypothetical protein
MHLKNHPRCALIQTALGRLPRRYRRRAEALGSKIQVIGLFQPQGGGPQYLALRFGLPGRRALYARMYPVRREYGWAVLALPASGFDWRDYREDLYPGDNVPAFRRLKRLAERRDVMRIETIGGPK